MAAGNYLKVSGRVSSGAPGLTDIDSSADARVPAAGVLSTKVSLLYAAVYLHYGLFSVFMPVWLTHRGLHANQVGVLAAVPMLLRVLFVAPVTNLADRTRRIRELLFLCIAMTAALMVALSLVSSFVALAIFFVVLSMSWDPLPILADAYAVASIRARGLDYGRMRVWGSLAYIGANIAGGKLIDRAGIQILPVFTAILLLAPLMVIPFLPADRHFGDPAPSQKGEWRSLLRDAPLVVVVIAAALIVSSQALYGVFSAIHWTSKGISAGYIGMLSGVGIGSEIAVLWVAQRLLGQRSPLWLIVIFGVLAVVRWLLLALDPGPLWLVPIQLLQGSGMGVVAGLMLFIARRVPQRLIATAQGVNAVVQGVVAAVAVAASGFLWQAFGTAGYVLMALIAVAGIAMIGFELAKTDRDDGGVGLSDGDLVMEVLTEAPIL